jgi:hypothetical protein
MSQDNLVWIAVVVLIIGSVGLGNPTVQKIGGGILNTLKSFFSRKPDTDTDVDTIINMEDTHEIIEVLIDQAEEDKDEEGLMLLAAYGKHLYDRRIPERPTARRD